MTLDADGYASPFPGCVRLPGHFGGSCGNCIWRSQAACCSKRDAPYDDGGNKYVKDGAAGRPNWLLEG
ncbi:hypothetical protein ACQKWADRAFT_307710 [Trichoderma austrokoningii]